MGYVEGEEEEKKNPQIIGIMCSMGFKHTHIQTGWLMNQTSHRKSKGGNKGRHKGGTIWNGLTLSGGSVAKGRTDRVA